MTFVPTTADLREAARLSRADFRLILASQSPRRRQLLDAAGLLFEVMPARDGVESAEDARRLDPSTLVFKFARQKAYDVVARLPAPSAAPILVLACDSVAECQGETLGKPLDRSDAERMLRKLSGSIHYVRTGVAIIPIEPRNAQRLQPLAFVETSTLEMEPLSEERLASYLESGLWRGKAGAFGYQDGNDWLRLVGGTESNVVGLPIETVARAIVRLGRELKNV